MPKVDLYDINGKVVGDIELKDEIFNAEINTDAMYLAVESYLANQRQGTQSTKTRSEVSGGGVKPWRQKGTGRARQGSIRAPQWIHGGIALGPKPRTYTIRLNKKVKRTALKSALSSKVAESDIIVLDKLELSEIKTKNMAEILKNFNLEKNALIVLGEKNENVVRSAKNIPNVKTAYVNTINVYDIVKYNKFIVTADAVHKIEEVYA